MQVSENVHRLTQGVANFYLIEESGRCTLIDAGTPGDWSYFRRSLAALGGSLTDLDAVLLTHAHPDHTGFAERARAQAAARVWVHQGDAEAAKTGKAAAKFDGKMTSYSSKTPRHCGGSKATCWCCGHRTTKSCPRRTAAGSRR